MTCADSNVGEDGQGFFQAAGLAIDLMVTASSQVGIRLISTSAVSMGRVFDSLSKTVEPQLWRGPVVGRP